MSGILRALGLEEAPGGGSTVYGEATVSFGEGSEFAWVVVPDTSVLAASKILASMAYTPALGRDVDELEMDTFNVMVGSIDPGVSFTVAVRSLEGSAHGDYLIHYQRN